jgi:hypothetical protein
MKKEKKNKEGEGKGKKGKRVEKQMRSINQLLIERTIRNPIELKQTIKRTIRNHIERLSNQ